MKMKRRLDVILVERGLVPSRERAQALILAGHVLVNDTPVVKSGTSISEDSQIRIRGEDHPYVSRAALKLEGALKTFLIDAQGKTALDVGASTGGFTQILLMKGATKVFAVDVGHSQMDWKIRSDSRVVCLEKVNARHMTFAQIGQKVDIIVCDVSFISLEKILPALQAFSHADTDWVTLIKPQFEAGPEKVGKGGIVTDEGARLESVERVTRFAESLGLERVGLVESPITGTQGNQEYLAWWKQRAEKSNY